MSLATQNVTLADVTVKKLGKGTLEEVTGTFMPYQVIVTVYKLKIEAGKKTQKNVIDAFQKSWKKIAVQDAQAAGGKAEATSVGGGTWKCAVCTFSDNPNAVTECEMCGSAKP